LTVPWEVCYRDKLLGCDLAPGKREQSGLAVRIILWNVRLCCSGPPDHEIGLPENFPLVGGLQRGKRLDRLIKLPPRKKAVVQAPVYRAGKLSGLAIFPLTSPTLFNYIKTIYTNLIENRFNLS
jgi:hypothetical protein